MYGERGESCPTLHLVFTYKSRCVGLTGPRETDEASDCSPPILLLSAQRNGELLRMCFPQYCLLRERDYLLFVSTLLLTLLLALLLLFLFGGPGNNRTNSYVEDGKLFLQPTLTSDYIGAEQLRAML